MDLAWSLRVFSRIVETGSMTAAARDLGVSQPKASKLLKSLEHHCGVRLLARSPRGMRPTAEGDRLHATVSLALPSIEAAIEDVRRTAAGLTGALRLHSPFCLGERHLNRIAGSFRERHPAVAIELTLGNSGVDLVREDIDLAFGHGRPSGPSIVQRKIGSARRVLVASPGYLDRHGAPATAADLRDHAVAVTDASLGPDGELPLVGPRGPVSIEIVPALRTNSVQALRDAVLGGRAIGTAQVLLVAEELGDGRLVRVLPDHEIAPSEVHLSYRSARLMRPVVRAFVDFAIPAIRRIEGIDR